MGAAPQTVSSRAPWAALQNLSHTALAVVVVVNLFNEATPLHRHMGWLAAALVLLHGLVAGLQGPRAGGTLLRPSGWMASWLGGLVLGMAVTGSLIAGQSPNDPVDWAQAHLAVGNTLHLSLLLHWLHTLVRGHARARYPAPLAKGD